MKTLSFLINFTCLVIGVLLFSLQLLHFNRTAKLLMVTKTNVTYNHSAEFINRQREIPSVKTAKRDRMAIICYIGSTGEEVRTFLTMLYGSWRFINEERKRTKLNITNDIDIVTFCEPKVCKQIEHFCSVIDSLDLITVSQNQPKCWAVSHPNRLPIKYLPMNSYVMFNRSDISYLIPNYKYLFRTDYDVFLTPALLSYKLRKDFLFGIGGYSIHFNIERLNNISNMLGLVYRDVNNIGSTWLGETELFLKCGKITLKLTEYLYLNEFKPNLIGLEKFNMEKNPNGVWPDWWKPVSSMYGAELALNHLIKDISSANQEPFDTSSCSTESIWTTPHIHCWHRNCEFQKFEFHKNLKSAIETGDGLKGKTLHRLKDNMHPRDISNMTIKEYATHVAWNSAGRYLRRWFVL